MPSAGTKPRVRVAARANGEVLRRTPLGAANLAGSSLMGGYEGSQRERRLFAFRPSEAGINSLLVFAGQTLRARARYLVRNHPFAKKAQRVFVTNLVGTGVRPIPLVDDISLKAEIGAVFEQWTEECDADGLLDFYGLQGLIARAMFDAGECFLRFRPRYARDGLKVPVQCQLLESEFCPYELNYVADNGNLIRAGVEFNPIGQRVAYWFWRTHPGEYAMPTTQVGYTRVPAEDVLHLFEPLRPGQIRGVSWLSAAIVRAFLTDQYEDAELERKKVAALFAGFVTRPDNSDADPPIAPQDQPSAGTSDTSMNAPGEAIAGLTPGMMQILLPGEEITFSNPADVGGNFEAFLYRAMLAVCAGMDMPYSSVTGDRTKTTYSSERANLLDLRAAMRQVQNVVVKHQLCRQVYARVVSDAVVAGALPIRAGVFNDKPRAFNRAKWIAPRTDWVDPLKDVQADRIAVRSGFESREAVALSRGMTIEELDAEIARGNASADSHSLVLDSDPRRTDLRGSAPAPVTQPPPPETGKEETSDDVVEVDDEPDQTEDAA